MRKLGIAPLVLLSAACGSQQSIETATASIALFHTQLDAGNYEAIWNTADDAMRQAGPKAEFVKFLDAVHTKLGRVKAMKQAGWRVNETTGGEFVMLQENTMFEKGTGTEVFTYAQHGDRLTLVGYQINSRDMMMN
jgi:hypothetical protein